MMAYIRPGDIVEIKKDSDAIHPNFNRQLRVGDRLLVVKRGDSYITYQTNSGDKSILIENVKLVDKGYKEDCMDFLARHNLQPRNKDYGRYVWACLKSHKDVHAHWLLPLHLYRHVRGTVSDYGITFKSSALAIEAALNAWLKMTPAQQEFYKAVSSVEEIFP